MFLTRAVRDDVTQPSSTQPADWLFIYDWSSRTTASCRHISRYSHKQTFYVVLDIKLDRPYLIRLIHLGYQSCITPEGHPGVCRLFELCAWTSAGQTLEAKNEAESSRYDCGSTDRQDGRMVISHFRSVEYWSRTFTFIFLRLSIFNDCWCNRCAAQLTNRPSSSPTTIVFTY